MFLYRENELALLKEDYDKPTSSLTFIFGRRKIGKTSLINEYTKDKKPLYLCAFETINHLLLKEFKKSIDEFFNINHSKKIQSLEELFSYLQEQTIENKIVIVLEDIQELLKIDKNFLINFNSYWNNYLKKMNIQFIITSALLPNNFDLLSISKKVDNKIRLKSLNFNVIKKLLPELNKEQTMYIFSAFGTNPKYLSLYNVKKDFILNIKDNFLINDGFLYNEGINLIKKDLGDVVTYCSILYAISLGNNKIGDIADFLNFKSSYLTRYIQKLIDLMIINKIVPINENPSKSKFGRYIIEDNFLKFWFSYIYANVNNINSNNTYNLIVHIKSDFIKRHVLSAYKKHAYEILDNNIDTFFDYTPKKIGSWWNNKDLEIDFITYDSKIITFVDCIWQNNNLEDDYKELEKKAMFFNTQLEKRYIIFTRKNKTVNK